MPELRAWTARHESTVKPLAEVKALLATALGPKYVASLKGERRVRDAYRAWLIMATSEGRDRARAWFAVPNSLLGDPRRTPAQAIRDGAGGLVVAAAGQHVVNGWSA